MRRHEMKLVHNRSVLKSTKASMQLSINAIVILVMAMAVLGIGLGLIRGVLAPAQNNLEDALGKVDLNEVATSTKPIANLPQSLRMKSGSENELVISYYNTGKDACDSAPASIAMECNGKYSQTADCGSDANCIQINSLPIKAEPGTASTLIANVEPKGFAVGSTPCKVLVICANPDSNGVLPAPVSSGSNANIVEEQAVFVNFGS